MKHSKEIRVGAFVITALLVGGGIIFMLGSARQAFSSKAHYMSDFADVAGLSVGGPVRVSGVNIGSVETIIVLENGRVEVGFEVLQDKTSLMREGTVATIGSKGLLGDRILSLVVGKGKQVPPGGRIKSEAAPDLESYAKKASEVLVHVTATARNLDVASQAVADQQLWGDLHRSVGRLDTLLTQMTEGKGLLPRLLRDEHLGEQTANMIVDASATFREMRGAGASLRAVLAEVETGDGGMHQLIYGPEGADAARNFAHAAGELAAILEAVRTQDGPAHTLVYGGDADQTGVMNDIAQITEDMRSITGSLRRGEGTLGALLVDPAVYENLQRLLGNVERNLLLRTLVRHALKSDNEQPVVRDELGSKPGAAVLPQTPAKAAPPVPVKAAPPVPAVTPVRAEATP